MRKLSLLVGVLAAGAVSLQASGIAARQSSGDTSRPDRVYAEECESLNTFSVGYVGGVFGPNAEIIAEDGVYTAVTPNALKKSMVTTKNKWSNGFVFGATFNTFECNPISLDYKYLRNKSNPTEATDKSSSTDFSATKRITFVQGDQITAATAIDKAEGRYVLNNMHDFSVTAFQPIFETEKFAFAANYGFAGLFMDHYSELTYTMSAANDTWKAVFNNDTKAYGINIATQVYKKFDMFAFGGGFGISSYLSKTDLGVTSDYFDGTTGSGSGKGVNTGIPLYDILMQYNTSLAFTFSQQVDNVFLSLSLEGSLGIIQNAFRGFNDTIGSGIDDTQDITTGTLEVNFGVSY